jgi:hypothetical protein
LITAPVLFSFSRALLPPFDYRSVSFLLLTGIIASL